MRNEEYKEEILEEIEADDSIALVKEKITSDEIEALIKDRDVTSLREKASSLDPHNIADALSFLNGEDMLFFFKVIPSDDSAEVFTLLSQENKERLLKAFSDDDIQRIFDEMSTDNIVDFLDDLPANLVNKVLVNTSLEDRDRIKTYLKFKEDSAGTLMTPEYLSVKDDETVESTIKKIREKGRDMETIWRIYVIDDTRKLIGETRLDTLLESDENDLIRSIMDVGPNSVTIDTDQEIVIQAFRKYDISVLPVTDNNNRLVGIITFDDVMDAAEEETTEDVQLTAAVVPSDVPYVKNSVLKLVKSYAPWIIFLLVLNTFTSMVLSYLNTPLAILPILTAFLTSVMGTNGNASDQTCTVIIRELALGNITTKNYWKTVFKEFKASVVTSACVAIFSFCWVLIELYSGLISLTAADDGIIATYYAGNQNVLFVSVAAVIALTFFISIVIAKFLGVSLPVLAKKIHLDPAVMSQPVISNILDIISICIYYVFAVLIIKGL